MVRLGSLGRETQLGKSELDVLDRLRALEWPPALAQANARLSLEQAYVAGKLIREEVYPANEDLAGSARFTLRRLQGLVLPRASFATLARCVQIYDACTRLGMTPPLKGVKAGHLLNMTHLSPAAQRQLVQRLRDEQWSVRELRETAGRTSGRLRLSGLRRALAILGAETLEDELETLARVDRAQARELKQKLALARRTLARLEAALP